MILGDITRTDYRLPSLSKWHKNRETLRESKSIADDPDTPLSGSKNIFCNIFKHTIDRKTFICYTYNMDNINVQLGKLVRKLREELEISQDELAVKLDVPRPAISQIESGQRKISADELLKLSKVLNVPLGQLMGVEPFPKVSIARDASNTTYRANREEIRISVPQKNISKFQEVLLYILNKIGSKPNIGETVLYKLLYFIDFNFFEKYEEQLIGATYIKNHYGPTPVEFKKLIDKMIEHKEVERVKSGYFSFPQTKYLPIRLPDLAKLSARELEVIDQVLNRLSDMNATQISEYSHKDVPWMTTEEGQKIEYEAVFYRTPEYSVREYGKTI